MYDTAWHRILSNTSDRFSSEAWRTLFPDKDDYLEEFQFSTLHSVVLGLGPGQLEEVLAKPDIDVNASDSYGRTALSWAVQRRDHASTKLLLHHGADPNIASCSGDTPAAYAAYWHNHIGMRLLLEFGALVTQRNRDGRNCLHYLNHGISQCGTLEVLIAAGCDIHEKNRYGSTPFSVAAAFSDTTALSTLMSYGSDINTIDLEGDSPLLNSIFNKKDENTRLLLERGANHTLINDHGHSVLHCAALCGGLVTLEILRSARLSCIDPAAKDKTGKTALQLAQERHTKPEDFINLFLTLLFEIRCRNDAFAQDVGESRGAESEDGHEAFKTAEAGGTQNSPGELNPKANNANTSRAMGAAELGRDDDENDGESGDAFFDALEQQ